MMKLKINYIDSKSLETHRWFAEDKVRRGTVNFSQNSERKFPSFDDDL